MKTIQKRIDTNKIELDRLQKQCIKTIHKNTCKCRLLPFLHEEIITLNHFREKHIKTCSQNYEKIVLNDCTSTLMCSECKKSKRYEDEITYTRYQYKFEVHNCLANWDGSPRGMEGESGSEQIINFPKVTNTYPYILVKDDDGTITAKASTRKWTKEEIRTKKFWPIIKCIQLVNIPILQSDQELTYPSDSFVGEKIGYVFYNHVIRGMGYHFDTHPAMPYSFSEEKVEPISFTLQSEKGKFEPDYEYSNIGTLADPSHRCRNFGKDIKVLEKAPLSVSKIRKDLATRIIKLFK